MVALGNTLDLRSSFLHFRLLVLGFFWLAPPFIEDGQKKDTEKPPFVCLVDHRAADIDKSSCCSPRHSDSGKSAEASSAWWPSRTQTRILSLWIYSSNRINNIVVNTWYAITTTEVVHTTTLTIQLPVPADLAGD